MINACPSCIHYRPAFGGRCHRDMLMQSGQVIKQHNSGRSTETERDEKHKTWKSVRRDMADICGKAGKWWKEK
ncbi:MAG: hypothetical protein ABJA10_02775 [Aestuariivirga sp.]